MRVFISWSGNLSHRIALQFRHWLPLIIQSIDPYVSSEDIDKGTRWSSDISHELESCSIGVLCVTRSNLTAPWLNFEAGALSKSLDQSRVIPFLFGLRRSDVQGPLVQFQSAIYTKQEVFKLIQAINRASDAVPLAETRLNETFEMVWPPMKKSIDSLEQEAREESGKEAQSVLRSDAEMIEETLELVRQQQLMLRDFVRSNDTRWLAEELGVAPRYIREPRVQKAAVEIAQRMDELMHLSEMYAESGSIPLDAVEDNIKTMRAAALQIAWGQGQPDPVVREVRDHRWLPKEADEDSGGIRTDDSG